MKIIKINENTFLIKTDKYVYTFTIDRINKYNCKQHWIQQKEFLNDLVTENFIKQQHCVQGNDALENWFKHCSHSMINVIVQNLKTNTVMNYSVPLTQRDKNVEIIKSISEDFLGEKAQHFSVIKIAPNLFITSHFLIINGSNNDKLKFSRLQYDEDKDCYVDVSNSNKIYFKNLTQDNIKKAFIDIVKRFESDQITIVDITNSSELESDIICVKNIEKWQEGVFDKTLNNSYEEVGKTINNFKWNMNIEKEKINKKERSEDEL